MRRSSRAMLMPPGCSSRCLGDIRARQFLEFKAQAVPRTCYGWRRADRSGPPKPPARIGAWNTDRAVNCGSCRAMVSSCQRVTRVGAAETRAGADRHRGCTPVWTLQRRAQCTVSGCAWGGASPYKLVEASSDEARALPKGVEGVSRVPRRP